jgi:hypothetical protein
MRAVLEEVADAYLHGGYDGIFPLSKKRARWSGDQCRNWNPTTLENTMKRCLREPRDFPRECCGRQAREEAPRAASLMTHFIR